MKRHETQQIAAWLIAIATSAVLFAGVYKMMPRQTLQAAHGATHDNESRDDAHHESTQEEQHAPSVGHAQDDHKPQEHGKTEHENHATSESSHIEKHDDEHDKKTVPHGSEHKATDPESHEPSATKHADPHTKPKDDHGPSKAHGEDAHPAPKGGHDHSELKAKQTDTILAAALQPDWNYLAASPRGPKHWGNLNAEFQTCQTGKHQSPVELAQITKSAAPSISYHSINLSVISNGLWTILQPTQGQNEITWQGQKYSLQHVHLRSPGEHTVNGVRADLEMQFYHRSAAGKHLALAVGLTERSESENSALQKILNVIPRVPTESSQTTVSLAEIVPTAGKFISYKGSVTFPPCEESVDWLVLKEPVPVSGSQVDLYTSIFASPAARPLQSQPRFSKI